MYGSSTTNHVMILSAPNITKDILKKDQERDNQRNPYIGMKDRSWNQCLKNSHNLERHSGDIVNTNKECLSPKWIVYLNIH